MKYRDLFGLTVQRIELLIEKTRLSHQEFRNIGFSGEEVERDVRLLLSEILPSKYEVKHGYVAYALNSEKEPVVSPQVDVIIVDSAVPGTLFVLDSTSQMELVAGESVVGIIEVKRTLSRESLLGKKRVAASADHPSEAGPKVTEEPLVGKMFAKPDRSATDVGPVKATDIVCDEFRFDGALPHLQKIIEATDRADKKTVRSTASTPLLAVLGIDHEDSLFAREAGGDLARGNLSKLIDVLPDEVTPPVDLIASLSGFMWATAEPENEDFYPVVPGNSEPFVYAFLRCDNGREPKSEVEKDDIRSRPYILSRILGFVIAYLSRIEPRDFNVESYFFNECLFEGEEDAGEE